MKTHTGTVEIINGSNSYFIDVEYYFVNDHTIKCFPKCGNSFYTHYKSLVVK